MVFFIMITVTVPAILAYGVHTLFGIPGIPGPMWRWPSGNLTEKFIEGRQLSAVWGARHGPVYQVWAGLTPEIVITTPEDVRHFCSDSAAHVKSPGSNAGWLFHQLLGRCLGLVSGTEWSTTRARFHRAGFSRHAASARAGAAIAAAEAFAATPDLAGATSALSDPTTAFARLAFFHTAEHIYGKLEPSEREALWALGQRRQALLRFVLRGGVYRSALCRIYDPSAARELDAFLSRWSVFNRTFLECRRADECPPPFIRLWAESSGDPREQQKILQTVDEMLFANLDVTTHVVSWMFILLGRHPAIQDELRAEVRLRGHSPRVYVTDRRTLLHRCLLETMRLRPVSGFSIPEYSPSEKVFSGRKIAAGTSVIVDLVALNVRNPFWGADAAEFRPARFECLKDEHLRLNFFTFGLGSRTCLGQYDAELLLKALARELIARFTVEVIESGLGGGSAGTWIPFSRVALKFTRLPDMEA